MNATLVLAATLVIAFGLLGTAKLAAVPAMRSRAEHVGFTVPAYRRIGALELLGVLGLLVGAFVPVIGILAAVGLLLLLAGAVFTHLRKGDGVPELAPAVVIGVIVLVFLGLAITDLR